MSIDLVRHLSMRAQDFKQRKTKELGFVERVNYIGRFENEILK